MAAPHGRQHAAAATLPGQRRSRRRRAVPRLPARPPVGVLQQWFRSRAQPGEKSCQHSMDLPRGLRSPLTLLPTTRPPSSLASTTTGGATLFASCLSSRSPTGSNRYAGWCRRRKDPAADEVRAWRSPPANRTSEPSLTTLQRWHAHVVDQNALAPLVRAMAAVHPQPTGQLRGSRSCACPRRRAVLGEERHQHAVRARLLGVWPGCCRPRCAGHSRLAQGRQGHPAAAGLLADIASPSGGPRPPGCGAACGHVAMPLAGYAARLVPLTVF